MTYLMIYICLFLQCCHFQVNFIIYIQYINKNFSLIENGLCKNPERDTPPPPKTAFEKNGRGMNVAIPNTNLFFIFCDMIRLD